MAQLAVRAGEPPSGVEVLVRAQRMERFHLLDDFWVQWQQWFAEVEETHTSLGVLSFFRSPLGAPVVGHRDAARCSTPRRCGSPRSTSRSIPRRASASAAAFFALRAVAGYFGIPVRPRPAPDDPISISEDEFLEACDRLVAAAIPVRADRDAGVARLHRLAGELRPACCSASPGFVMAPYAPWSSDRSLRYRAAAPAATARDGAAIGASAQKSQSSGSAGVVVEADEPLDAEGAPERVVGRARGRTTRRGIWRRVRGHRGPLAVEHARRRRPSS